MAPQQPRRIKRFHCFLFFITSGIAVLTVSRLFLFHMTVSIQENSILIDFTRPDAAMKLQLDDVIHAVEDPADFELNDNDMEEEKEDPAMRLYPEPVEEDEGDGTEAESEESNDTAEDTQDNDPTLSNIDGIESPPSERNAPKIIWLMSYPNSGTSFTMNYIQSSSNKTVATNYGAESRFITPDGHLQPVDPRQNKGPWILSPLLEVPDNYIMTKTHCGGYCIECGPKEYMMTNSAFAKKCAEVTLKENGRWAKKVYKKEAVKKAIHLMRNPFNNMVSNFHLQFKNNKNNNDWTYTNDKSGFHKWCQDIDSKFYKEEKELYPRKAFKYFKNVPCHGTFLKYIRWHNLASDLRNSMKIPTIVMWYEDYETDFEQSTKKLFNFLEADRIDHAYKFHPGKSYLNYFSRTDKKKIKSLIQMFSSKNTWKLIKRYF